MTPLDMQAAIVYGAAAGGFFGGIFFGAAVELIAWVRGWRDE